MALQCLMRAWLLSAASYEPSASVQKHVLVLMSSSGCCQQAHCCSRSVPCHRSAACKPLPARRHLVACMACHRPCAALFVLALLNFARSLLALSSCCLSSASHVSDHHKPFSPLLVFPGLPLQELPYLYCNAQKKVCLPLNKNTAKN